ncbi:MAG: VWA domain-containing protein [Methylophaga sp.]|nr:VWA domain-containing protein [Methylophaga sp.]
MKSLKHHTLTIAIACSLLPFSTTVLAQQSPQYTHTTDVIAPAPIHQPKIQLAILLDTSSSMDGLIDQTRNQIWQVVNEFSTAKQNGLTPILEVALFEYGNNGNSENDGHVRQLSSFTRELDKVSEGLFSLTTNGGDEYCGYAIKTAVNDLQWSSSDNNIKTIFIAGNEPFTQGPVNYQSAIELAKKQGISVNTIHAGDHQEGIDSGWQSAAVMTGGSYMSIDSNIQVVHIDAPQDKEIAALNIRLNETYIAYGNDGEKSKSRQLEQDKNSSAISAGLLAKRAVSKVSSFYNNKSWDLVDAMEEGEVDESALADMDQASLPEPMKSMSAQEKKDYVIAKSEQRKEIQQQISELSKSRDSFVAEKQRDQIAAAPSMSDALTGAIRKQAEQKNFVFDK